MVIINYIYNYTTNFIKKIDSSLNPYYNVNTDLFLNTYSITQDWFTQSFYDIVYPEPGYNIKLKLSNRLDFEDSLVLNAKILGESLGSGTHHFVISLDTVNGVFVVYIDGVKYYERTFSKGMYSFYPVLKQNLIFGNTPFYGGINYDTYYKSKKETFYANDLILEKIKMYNCALNEEEVKLLYYEKYPPSKLVVDINSLGERNFIDTISRFFKHKKPGMKTNLINIFINDSTIVDKNLRDYYESVILTELKRYLPVHVKINSIRWVNNKRNDQIIPEGYFDTFISISTI